MQDIPLGVTTLPIESADDVFVTSEITLAPFCTQEKKYGNMNEYIRMDGWWLNWWVGKMDEL